MTASAWGDAQTKHFFELTPEKILDSVERFGLRCTGRCLALNSMENRVYEVEIETAEADSPSAKFRVAKFYRPGRWTKAQISEEHQFLEDLDRAEIPAVPAIKTAQGGTLLETEETKILFAIFPKRAGRCKDELNSDELAQVGRLIARMHGVGASRQAKHRLKLNLETYGENNLNYLLEAKLIPTQLAERYRSICLSIFDLAKPRFEGLATQRIHGDAHVGNLLWNSSGPVWVDFDDMLIGPPVQDLWLLVPGRDEESKLRREKLIEGYEQMRDFDRSTLNLVESLRALRMIHFAAWIGRRWEDPSFPRVFPQYGSERYWVEQIQDLSEQLELIREGY